jgi:hypothetical protein
MGNYFNSEITYKNVNYGDIFKELFTKIIILIYGFKTEEIENCNIQALFI